MTGRELTQWILDNNALNLPVEVAYRNKQKVFDGTDPELLLKVIEVDGTDDSEYWRCLKLII